MNIKNSLSEIIDNFDAFVFDSYGVLWSGEKFFDGLQDFLSQLVKTGKIVYILSNSTFRSSTAVKQYEKYNFKQGEHYSKFITNGEIVHNFLLGKLLTFKTNNNPIKYYNLFYKNKALFENTQYIEVDELEKADFVYIGIPRINNSQTKIIKKYSKFFNNFGKNIKTFFDDGEEIWYDSLSLDPFMDEINKVANLKLPVLNINPDFTAKENGSFVIRQGTIAEELRKQGCEVIQFGKPSKITFENALKDLSHISKDRILMIGDSLKNDIKGANNYGIKSALVCETGLTANEIFKNNTINKIQLEKLIKEQNVKVDYFIRKVVNNK